MFTELLAKRLLRIADEREPDEIIGPRETPYMLRWWIVRKPPGPSPETMRDQF